MIMDGYGAQLVKEHREIVKAIRSGNAHKASERAAEHVTNAGNRAAAIDVRSATLPDASITGAAGWLSQTHMKVKPQTKRTAGAKLSSV